MYEPFSSLAHFEVLAAMRHLIVLSFFFSSRRRHTRSYGDWSSDVCSSDLFQDSGTTTDNVSQLVTTSGPTKFVPTNFTDPSNSLSVNTTAPGSDTVSLGTKIGRASCRERACGSAAAA